MAGEEDGSALGKNRSMEFSETSGDGRGVRGEVGERETGENGAPSPKLFQFSSYRAFLRKNKNISGSTAADATKKTSFEGSRRVESESRKARGPARRFSRKRVCKHRAASSSSSLPPVKVTLQLPHKVIDRALHCGPTLEFSTSPSTAPVPSPTIPSPELPVASQSQLFLSSMTLSSVHYPDHTLTPANFSPLAGVDELQEMFKGGFSAMATRLLQDEEMPVVPKEIPVAKEESPIEIVPQETPGRTSASPSPSHGPSSSPARMTPWLHALDERIKQLEEIVETNKIEVMGMHEDLARVMVRVSRFGNAVLEQRRQLREIQELWEELPI
ncbi:hypothetical protein EDC04DRAFT_2903012 [Pisolithus marmoratus]|nr:hypothetical protein EDC04DRAFT_2903012 [Pisolithus marmoratus]